MLTLGDFQRLKKFSAADLVAWRVGDCCLAARDFLFQPRDARFQFMRGKGGNILAQLDLRRFLARGRDRRCPSPLLGVRRSTVSVSAHIIAGICHASHRIENPGPDYRL